MERSTVTCMKETDPTDEVLKEDGKADNATLQHDQTDHCRKKALNTTVIMCTWFTLAIVGAGENVQL